MSLPRYPEYKDSGVQWLGAVPSGWNAVRLMWAASVNDDVLPESTSPTLEIQYVDIGSVSLDRGIERTEQFSFSEAPSRARRLVREGDVLVSTVRTYLKAIAPIVSPLDNLVVSTGFAVVRPNGKLQSGYAKYALQASGFVDEVISRSTGISYPAINASDLVRIAIPVPPIDQQSSIATFLDRETVKLDKLIAEQEKLITLLAEKRRATISHAVTRGLNPDTPMKDSGVAWLGFIPAHWEVSQSRRMFAVRSEPALASDRMLTASQKYGVLYQSDFVEREGRRVVEVILGVEHLRHVEPNDFIISMRSFQGGIEWCKLRGSTSFHYVMLRPLKWVHPPFFAHLLKSSVYIQALRTTTNLIRDGQELRFSNFAQVDLPVVPLEEQIRIAAFLDEENLKLDSLAAESASVIRLLRERRSALIAAAVTGQIDVRAAVRPVPTEAAALVASAKDFNKSGNTRRRP